jgi:quinoprotein glucose dehydrogenase
MPAGARALAALAAFVAAGCEAPTAEPPQVPGAAAVADYVRGSDWPTYNRDLGGTRYSPLREITATNVDELRQAWAYPLGAVDGGTPLGSELTPVVIAGVLYATAADRVVALKADTGDEIWRFALPPGAPSRRGLTYWPGDLDVAERIFFTAGRKLVALDAATGLKALAFGASGEAELPVIYNAAPTPFESLLIVGSTSLPGGVRAYDARTGALRWAFEPEPSLLHPSFSVTVDVDRALLYAAFAGPEADTFYGGAREVVSPFANSVVALDARTGVRRWHFQTVHHDVWDYDLLAPPALVDVAVRGTRVPLLVQAGRTGYLYVLNRVTGEPAFGIVETPMPASDVPGEASSPTQPIPLKPPPVARVSYAAEDLVAAADTTPEHAAFCRALRDRSGGLENLGPFTPFRHRAAGAQGRSRIVFPGSLGGATSGGVAVDPSRGLVFVNTSSEGGIGWIEPNAADATSAQTGEGARSQRLPYRRMSAVGGPLARFWSNDAEPGSTGNERDGGTSSWPCQKPPWGQLTAVSLATGDIVWQVPLGITDQLPEGRKRTGRLNLGGPMATAAGLVFIGASNDRRFRAFDARTGAELWVTELPMSAHAVPVTYSAADGKQYVAIVAAGVSSIDEAAPADAQSLIAYALP